MFPTKPQQLLSAPNSSTISHISSPSTLVYPFATIRMPEIARFVSVVAGVRSARSPGQSALVGMSTRLRPYRPRAYTYACTIRYKCQGREQERVTEDHDRRAPFCKSARSPTLLLPRQMVRNPFYLCWRSPVVAIERLEYWRGSTARSSYSGPGAECR